MTLRGTGRPSGRRIAAIVVCALAVIAAASVALLARHGAFASERELRAAEVQQILEAGYGRSFELVSQEDDVRVTGESPKLDAASDPVSFDVGFEHVYRFRDGRGRTCTVWQQYRRESDGSLAKANQLYDDYWWQQLRPRLKQKLTRRGASWPGTWKLVDTPLHPHLEIEVSRFDDLDELAQPLKELRACTEGLALPRQNAASFHAKGSPFADLKHLPDPLMPRVDVLAARASDGRPFLIHWFTPFGDAASYREETSKRSFSQMRAAYARGVENGEISERLSAAKIAENLTDTFTRTSFYLGGYGPKSTNDFAWTYSAKAGDFTIAGSELRRLVEFMGGYYKPAAETGGQQTQWNIGDAVWEAEPLEGSDGSFDEGTIDLTSVRFERDGRALTVFDPDAPDELKRVYTLEQVRELLGASSVRADLDSGTVRITANVISGSQGIGLD